MSDFKKSTYTVGKEIVVFWGKEKLKSADAKTFEILGGDYTGGDYAKDQNYAFYRDHKIEEADAKSFQHAGFEYAKDKASVFYMGEKFDGN